MTVFLCCVRYGDLVSGVHVTTAHSIQFAQMSGTFTTVRNGVESLSWQFPSSSQIHIVEMRHLQHVTLYPLASDIPTVVIVVYDPADRHSMERVADLLDQDRCTWLPQGCPLALARSGGSSDPPRPVRRLQERAKKYLQRHLRRQRTSLTAGRIARLTSSRYRGGALHLHFLLQILHKKARSFPAES